MKKKVISVLLVSTLVFSLAGCNKDKDSTTEITDYSEYVTIGDYKGFTIEVAPADVTDEQLQTKIDSIIKEKTTYEEIKEGTVADGDVINLDYSGLLDGEAFDNGTAEGASYTVGSGGFIDDLDTQLVGLEVGKEYDLNCTFPETYTNNTDLAGKEVVFKVTVNSIQGDAIVPEWTDDFVNTYSEAAYTTTADYEKYLTDELEKENLDTQEQEYEQSLWTKILDSATISDYPEEKLNDAYEEYYNYYYSYYSYYAQLYGTDYETFLSANNMTDADVQNNATAQAQSELDYIMTAMEIAKAEGITLEDDEYESRVGEYAESLTYDSVDTFKDEYGESYIKESFLFDKVCDWLYDNSEMVVTEDAETTTAAESATTATDATTAAE